MGKCKIFRIIQFSILFFFATEKNIWAQQEENFEVEDNSGEDYEGREDFEPLKELPDAQPICPDLDRALDLATNNYKIKRTKIAEPVFKNLNLGIEISSLGKDLWFLIAQRKSKHRDYNFDYHGRIGTVWKYNFYLGGDFGFSTGKDCVWEGSDKKEGAAEENKKLDTKFAHLSKGFYLNILLGYNYHFDENNDVIFATKFGYAWTTIEKTYFEGEKYKIQPYWIGLFIAFENKIFSSPVFWGADVQINYLLNKKDIDDLENYFIPDYGHSSYKLNFGFNFFIGLKIDFKDQIIIP